MICLAGLVSSNRAGLTSQYEGVSFFIFFFSEFFLGILTGRAVGTHCGKRNDIESQVKVWMEKG